jgi:hypothetical protein
MDIRPPSRTRYEAHCILCGRLYRSNAVWACPTCEHDATAAALVEIATKVLAASGPAWLCPADGCLVLPGEQCPACRAEHRVLLPPPVEDPAPPITEEPDDDRCPASWTRRGLIWHPVYETSEVA